MRRAAFFLAFAPIAFAQHHVTPYDDGIRGAALGRGALYTWGARLLRWNLADGSQRVVASALNGRFGEGGCIGPDGAAYLQDGPDSGPLISIAASGARTQWDPRVEMHNCLAAKLLGHAGILLVDHYGQIRFYEAPGVYRELYSFYTPSRQAGLLLADVDGDRRPDILAGNYWIRSPPRFGLPWRLFAIDTRHETPDSATMSLALRGKDVFAAQGHLREGLLLQYMATAGPTQLWTERIAASGLHYPHALAASADGVVAGENNGPGSRLFFIDGNGSKVVQIGTTAGTHTAFIAGRRILTVGANDLTWWDFQRRK